jgi:D-alanine-D-alanine ligase
MKKNIAILYGGDSSEKIISERSSVTIKNHLPEQKYVTYRVFVNSSEWKVDIANHQSISVDKNDFSFSLDGKKIVFDCAFIIIHGTPGENGILQAYFDLLGIPYTTCSAFVSALTFDKYACKCYLRSLGISMANDFLLKKTDSFDQDAIEKQIAYPMFVKPNAGGSSFGVTKVRSSEGLRTAVEIARKEDCDVIIESAVEGIELSHGIYSTTKRTLEFPVTQINSKNSFFDYEAKYEGKSEEITPAPITEELSKRVQTLTKTIANRLGCRGLVRIDYIYSNDKLYFIEINTVPGMSEASIIPQQILHAGFSISQVLDWLIEDALNIK